MAEKDDVAMFRPASGVSPVGRDFSHHRTASAFEIGFDWVCFE